MYGDTVAARKRVAQLREQGGDIRAVADRLVAQAEAVPWHGRAAEAMRARSKERAAHLRTAAGHHETAADSLTRHLTEVDSVKDMIETRAHKAALLVEDARNHSGSAEHPPAGDDHAAGSDDAETSLLGFTPPPAGHRDWLSVTLPGL